MQLPVEIIALIVDFAVDLHVIPGVDVDRDEYDWNRASAEQSFLFRASLVNRTWSQICVDRLWRRVPIRALQALPPERRQHFASKITSFTVRDSQAQIRLEGDSGPLRWSRLEHFDYHIWHERVTTRLLAPVQQYIQPQLLDLSIVFYKYQADEPLSDTWGSSLVEVTASQCTHLLKLSIKISDWTIEEALVVRLLTRCTALAEIVMPQMHMTATTHFLTSLLHTTKLTTVEMPCVELPLWPMQDRPLDCAPGSLPVLQVLSIKVTSVALSQLIPLFLLLSSVSVEITEYSHPIFDVFARLQNLRKLEVSSGCVIDLHRSESTALRRLGSRLTDLRLNGEPRNLSASSWDSADVLETFTCFPNLQVLISSIHVPYSDVFFDTLARASPSLKSCYLHGSPRISGENEDAVFHNLEEACFDSLQGPWTSIESDSQRVSMIEGILRGHFPALAWLQLPADTDENLDVMHAFQNIEKDKREGRNAGSSE